ncbi:MAG TPA: AtpZ/AtpI family protein [Chthonomonadaceae bacterium]|nr:AtpZ/AtpI family protein [Chthonomonadaceae bacterium]
MAEDPQKPLLPGGEFSLHIGRKERRKLRAQRDRNRDLWSGLRLVGLVGWTVVLSCLLGTALGIWIDKRFPGSYSWTLMLMLLGILLGCYSAWYWVARESQAADPGLEDTDTEDKENDGDA